MKRTTVISRQHDILILGTELFVGEGLVGFISLESIHLERRKEGSNKCIASRKHWKFSKCNTKCKMYEARSCKRFIFINERYLSPFGFG